ncbi:hypothetical protein KSP40_PGU020084 [Platanthera guangdongensis]|uniref:Galactose oxidase n=1 Tax=Platanthera guangdongensis TaxID=2320717 RepID=A0ABR2N2E0_9ASPA
MANLRSFFPAILLLLCTGASAQLDIIGNFLRGIDPNPYDSLLPSPLQPEPANAAAEPPMKRLDHETDFAGAWEIVKEDSGVSAMHLAITRENRAIMFDAVVLGPSRAQLPANNCRRETTKNGTAVDCWAHSVELDLVTYATRPLKVLTDTWCSSGGFAADGTLVSSGGFKGGGRSARFISPCPTCNWRDYSNSLAAPRWTNRNAQNGAHRSPKLQKMMSSPWKNQLPLPVEEGRPGENDDKAKPVAGEPSPWTWQSGKTAARFGWRGGLPNRAAKGSPDLGLPCSLAGSRSESGGKMLPDLGGEVASPIARPEGRPIFGGPALWYATQQILEDGSFVVLGGRRTFNYEFMPAEKAIGTTTFDLPFLRETTDENENNLYPFIHLSTDGNLFVFANNRSILLQPRTGRILREFPVLPGGARNYPSSGMSALLPINLRGQRSDPSKRITPFPAQVLICGGSPSESFEFVKNHSIYLPALKSCGRLTITDPAAEWTIEDMPVARTIGDMLILPNGDLLVINGAGKGCAGWDYAREPVFTPLLYMPSVTRAKRWRALTPTKIPRMYHSSSAVLQDASVLVSGSNTNPGYNFTTLFPTEMRVEKLRPPYLDPSLAAQRPSIVADSVRKELGYAESFDVEFVVHEIETAREDIKVTMYAPPFTTHGFSMNQRLLVLRIEEFSATVGANGGVVRVTTPPSGVIAPPGWYMLFVVNKGVPSEAIWVHIQARV